MTPTPNVTRDPVPTSSTRRRTRCKRGGSPPVTSEHPQDLWVVGYVQGETDLSVFGSRKSTGVMGYRSGWGPSFRLRVPFLFLGPGAGCRRVSFCLNPSPLNAPSISTRTLAVECRGGDDHGPLEVFVPPFLSLELGVLRALGAGSLLSGPRPGGTSGPGHTRTVGVDGSVPDNHADRPQVTPRTPPHSRRLPPWSGTGLQHRVPGGPSRGWMDQRRFESSVETQHQCLEPVTGRSVAYCESTQVFGRVRRRWTEAEFL